MSDDFDFSPGSPDWRYYGARGNRHIVDYYRRCHLNVMPLTDDGCRTPKTKFGQYNKGIHDHELVPDAELLKFRSPSGIAILCGVSSSFLEVIDFDGAHLFEPWMRALTAERGEKLTRDLVIVRTPRGGWHVYYRWIERQEGSQGLAWNADKKIQIETRAQGGFVVAPGGPDRTHPTGNPYRLVHGSFADIKFVGTPAREAMISIGRSFDLSPPKPPRTIRTTEMPREGRPGDDFNRRATWDDILRPAGWRILKDDGQYAEWQRPGKTSEGLSATTGYCQSESGNDLMKVFSSNANPFVVGETYNKFSAYANLYHNGDFEEAARDLAEKGYGIDIVAQMSAKVDTLFQRFGAN